MIFPVMGMNGYKKLPRLRAGDRIGNRHIAVQRHTSLAYPQHWHDYFEIELVVAGTGTHIFNGNAYPVSRGDAYLLTPVDFHEVEADSAVELINISFDEVWLSENMRTFLYASDLTKMRKFEEDDYQRFVMAAELLQHECRMDAPCVSQLLEYLLSRFLIWDLPRTESPVSLEHLAGIKDAVTYIELHFREKITLEKLSALSGYNPTYFSELFRKVTGETYTERLTALRINYARALLANGLSVSDACYASGFGSLSNFLTKFKAKCRMTPSEYRKKARR